MSLDVSLDENTPVCRICRDGNESGHLNTFCNCKGTVGSFHHACLVTWLKPKTADTRNCEICNFNYKVGQQRKHILQWTWRLPKAMLVSMVSLIGLVLLCVLGFVAFTLIWPVIEDDVNTEKEQRSLEDQLNSVNYGFVPHIPADMRVAIIFLQAGLFLVLVVSLVRLGEKCKPIAEVLLELNTDMVVSPLDQENTIVLEIPNITPRTTLVTDLGEIRDVALTYNSSHVYVSVPNVASPAHSSIGSVQLESSELLLPYQTLPLAQNLIPLRETVV